MMESGSDAWVVAVNLVIWSGLFVYLLILHSRLAAKEKDR